MSIYKDCDIRGICPEMDPGAAGTDDAFTEASARDIGLAMAALNPGIRMLAGGDHRLSTPALKAAFIDGLVAGGAHVTDIGTIPTPALYFAINHLKAEGGATVTASHNPPKYNGIKFMFGSLPPTRAQVDAIREAVEAPGLDARAIPAGSRCVRDVIGAYKSDMLRRFSGAAPLRVVVDAGNGAMGPVAPDVMRRCGLRVTELFCEPDGRFPNRDPNPADPGHLGAVCAKVVETGADFGVAFDGDGDRAVFIDERGRPVMNEKSLALFVRHLLTGKPTPVVYDQKSSSVVRRAILETGGTPMPERSGHAFIKRRFLEAGAAIAGEVSGHFFFGELGYDDALFAALTMARILASSPKPLSALADAIVCPPITPDIRLHCPYERQQAWLDAIEALSGCAPCTISRLDGIRLDFEDGWILARKSVTAEQITLRAEAETPQRLQALLDMIARALPEAAASALSGWDGGRAE